MPVGIFPVIAIGFLLKNPSPFTFVFKQTYLFVYSRQSNHLQICYFILCVQTSQMALLLLNTGTFFYVHSDAPSQKVSCSYPSFFKQIPSNGEYRFFCVKLMFNLQSRLRFLVVFKKQFLKTKAYLTWSCWVVYFQ